MKESVFKLVPERINFDKFWVEIRKRNRWLIYLRYGAVLMLTSLILSTYILHSIFKGFYIDTLPLWIIAASILAYNIVLHRAWLLMASHRIWSVEQKSEYVGKGFHSLHFSLIQIIIDFIALMLFIYFTGGVETPLYVFFIFHVIIGSLFLPGSVIALIVTGTILITLSGAILEMLGYVEHQAVLGFLGSPIYNNVGYLVLFFTLFSVVLYLSLYLANSISKQLYLRERSLTQAYQELADAEKTKSRYVMSVVHDLKTPIAAAMTYISMLIDGTLGELKTEQHRPLERIKKRLDGAVDTINNILYISQLKLDADIENREGVNVEYIFEEIYAEMRDLLMSKNIDFIFKCETKDEPIVQAGPKLLKLALSNLISNAYKYNNENGKIEVTVTSLNGKLSILIADTGIGIPEKDITKIFQEFYRTSISKRKGIEGTGLGMSIVLQIIQRFDGEILVESPSYLALGKDSPGTQFIVILPKTAIPAKL